MKSFFIVFFSSLILSCAQKPRIEFNQSSYYFHVFQHPRKTQWYETLKDSSQTIFAVYHKNPRGASPAQLNLFDEKFGFVSIPTSDTLKITNNTLVKIYGKIKRIETNLPYIKEPIPEYRFIPLEISTVKNLNSVQEKVNVLYRQLFPKIQNGITLRESKLKLKQKADWNFFYDAKNRQIIALSIQHDLMYQASIEFFIDANSEKIKKIRAKEWFKGEVE